jgi:hypothetical protein
MSRNRQPYVTLKQFVEQIHELQQRPTETIKLAIDKYCQVTFPTPIIQNVEVVSSKDDWNAINFNSNKTTSMVSIKSLLETVTPLAQNHPDAAVTINNELFDQWCWQPTTKPGLFEQTTLNTNYYQLTIEEFVTGLTQLKITNKKMVLDLAMEKFPGLSLILYRVGNIWMTPETSDTLYPQLATSTWTSKSFLNMFNSTSQGCVNIRECRLSEAEMLDKFGAKPKDLIDQLLEEAKITPSPPAVTPSPPAVTLTAQPQN